MIPSPSNPDREVGLRRSSLFGARAGWLLRDPVVRGYLATSGLLAVLLIAPVLSDSARRAVGDSLLPPIGMLWAIVAGLYGLTKLAGPKDRLFWSLMCAGVACWLAALLTYIVAEILAAPTRGSRVADLFFLASYFPVLLAIGLRPDLEADDRQTRVRLWLSGIGSFILLVGWFYYADVTWRPLPGLSEPQDVASSAVFPVLDLLLILNLVAVRRQCTVQRWRMLWGALTGAAVMAGLLDAVDLLVHVSVVDRHPGTGQSLLWLAPSAAFVVVARLRDAPEESVPAGARIDGQSGGDRFALGGAPLLGAFSFPFVHLTLTVLGIGPPDSLLPQLVVVGGMLGMASLAFFAYRSLETQRLDWVRDQRQMQEAAGHLQRLDAVGRLTDGLAHEFNNLLTAIGGSAEIALDHLEPDDAARGALEEVRKAAVRANGIARRLVRADTTTEAPSPTVNVSEAADAMRGTLTKLAGAGVNLIWDLDPALGRARIERTRFEQVLMNLVVNARDAMPNGGDLTIATARVTLYGEALRDWPRLPPGEYIRLEIRDTGTGIDPDVLPRIFDPFFTTKRAGQGTGLGLSLVQSIVADAGGRIRVATERGVGTTFTLLLPRSLAPTPDKREVHEASGTVTGETVLVVEDEPSVLALTTTILGRAGYRIISATSAEDALRLSDGLPEPIDLLLTDVIMPGMSGRVLADRLIERRPGIAVLFMTGYAGRALDVRGAPLASRRVVQKPFTARALTQAVKDVLRARGRGDERGRQGSGPPMPSGDRP